MAGDATRERIMDAADRLFGSHGYRGTSLRALTREAGVNLAAVNYHFGTKHELLHATLARHFEPINAERLDRLDALENESPDGRLSPRDILSALVQPAFEFSHASPANAEVIRGLSALLHTESMEVLRPLFGQVFGELSRRFESALIRALPELPPEHVSLRMGFAIGCMVWQLAGRNPPTLADSTLSDSERVDQLVRFLSAGLAAPSGGCG